jgi:hypothetical protein
VPDGTRWEQVSIEFINEDVVRIAVGGKVDHRDFAQMGFVDKRKPEERPDRLWGIFREFAKREGKIDWESSVDLPRAEQTKLKKWVSDIRTRLKAVFPQIPEDPFKPYRKVKAYETRFRLTTKQKPSVLLGPARRQGHSNSPFRISYRHCQDSDPEQKPYI